MTIVEVLISPDDLRKLCAGMGENETVRIGKLPAGATVHESGLTTDGGFRYIYSYGEPVKMSVGLVTAPPESHPPST